MATIVMMIVMRPEEDFDRLLRPSFIPVHFFVSRKEVLVVFKTERYLVFKLRCNQILQYKAI